MIYSEQVELPKYGKKSEFSSLETMTHALTGEDVPERTEVRLSVATAPQADTKLHQHRMAASLPQGQPRHNQLPRPLPWQVRRLKTVLLLPRRRP